MMVRKKMRDMSQVAGPPGLQDASIPTDCQEHLLLLCTSSSNKGEQHGTATGWQSNSVIGYWLVILALRSCIHIIYIYNYIYIIYNCWLELFYILRLVIGWIIRLAGTTQLNPSCTALRSEDASSCGSFGPHQIGMAWAWLAVEI